MISIAEHIAMETEGEMTPAQPSRVAFADLTTEHLRMMAAKTGESRLGWHEYTREQLLAFFHNRHGKYVPGRD